MEQKLDLRVRKTHKALLRSLYSLLSEKSFDEITVTELCDRAEIRKATFYKHFGDKTELFSYMVREMQQQAQSENRVVYDAAHPHEFYLGVFRYFLEFLDSNEPFIRKILSSSARTTIIDLMTEQITRDIRLHIREDARELHFSAEADMLAATYTGAMVSCGQWWITQPERPDKEVIIHAFSVFLMRLF